MSYEKFVELLEKRLREALPEEWDICIRTVIKNNGRERKGIVIREPGLNISPTIYLEGYFERYQRGYTLEEIGCQIKELYQHVKVTHRWEGGFLTEYENVRSRIIYRVVNCRKNQDYLRGIPYVPFLDLAVIFFVMLNLDGEDKTAFMPVGEEHLRLWNVKRKTFTGRHVKIHQDFFRLNLRLCRLLYMKWQGRKGPGRMGAGRRGCPYPDKQQPEFWRSSHTLSFLSEAYRGISGQRLLYNAKQYP